MTWGRAALRRGLVYRPPSAPGLRSSGIRRGVRGTSPIPARPGCHEGWFGQESPGRRQRTRSSPFPTPSPQPRPAASAARCGGGGGSEGTGTTSLLSLAPSRLNVGLKAGEAGPATGKGDNTFLLPPQLFPLVAGVHGGVAGGGFELQVPQAHEGVEETPRQSQSRAIPTPRAAAGAADPAGSRSGSAPAARCPSAGSRLALPRHPRSARPAPRRPLAPAAAAQQPPPPPPPPAPTRRSLSAVPPARRDLGECVVRGHGVAGAWVRHCVLCAVLALGAPAGRQGGRERADTPVPSRPAAAPRPPPPPLCFRVAAVPGCARGGGAVAERRRRGPGPSLARLARSPAPLAGPRRPWSVRDAGNGPGGVKTGLELEMPG